MLSSKGEWQRGCWGAAGGYGKAVEMDGAFSARAPVQRCAYAAMDRLKCNGERCTGRSDVRPPRCDVSVVPVPDCQFTTKTQPIEDEPSIAKGARGQAPGAIVMIWRHGPKENGCSRSCNRYWVTVSCRNTIEILMGPGQECVKDSQIGVSYPEGLGANRRRAISHRLGCSCFHPFVFTELILSYGAQRSIAGNNSAT